MSPKIMLKHNSSKLVLIPICVCPSTRKIMDKMQYWILLAAYHGLINTNATVQKQSDDLILRLGLQLLAIFPQTVYLAKTSQLVILVGKIIDDFFITNIPSEVKSFLADFNKKNRLVLQYPFLIF